MYKEIQNKFFLQSIFYASPVIGVNVFSGALTVIAGIYAKYYGLSLTSIATAMLIARLFDAISDPIIGYYSDALYLRTGSRKPFLLMGAFALIFCSYFLKNINF